MLTATTTRVPEHTRGEFNEQIRRGTEENVARNATAGPDAISRRLQELDHEWDIERTLEANAATISLLGVALGAAVDRRFFVLPAAVAGFLLQHALQGWCPPITFFRRRGFRTASEIDHERYTLKYLRGDFDQLPRDGERTVVDARQALEAMRA